MNRAALLISVLCCGAVACASGSPPTARPAATRLDVWVPVALTDVRDQRLRRTLTDLLLFVDMESLWPEFTLADHPAIVVDFSDSQSSAAYCIGHCAPRTDTAGTSRLWRRLAADTSEPAGARIASLHSWNLSGDGDVVAIRFSTREQTVTVFLHEHFHLHYQATYAQSFGDDIRGDGIGASRLARSDLENAYSASEPVTAELREECNALVQALLAGRGDRAGALAALHHFSAVRDARRARPGAPAFEEDFWERQEGVPVNLERRAARRLRFADPSVIETALTSDGCNAIPQVSYLLLLGGLESAVLDELGDPLAWPQRVYARDGASASSLYLLVRGLRNETEMREP